MARVQTTRWDVTHHLSGQADRLAYLDAALETGEASVIAAALSAVARAAGMGRVAADSQLGCESLYKAFAPGAKPRYDTVLKVLKALGIQLHAVPAAESAS